jgi:hypothetical protein
MNRKPPICAPCQAITRLVEAHPNATPYWRCAWCGRCPARRWKPPHPHRTPNHPEGYYSFPWDPQTGDLVVVEEGAKVWQHHRRSRRVVTPSPHPYLVTLEWVGHKRVTWRNSEDGVEFVFVWEILPAPAPLDLLAQTITEGRTQCGPKNHGALDEGGS